MKKRWMKKLIVGIIAGCCFSPFSQADSGRLLITELMASGNQTLADQDGEYPDWIELYNPGSQPVNLNGWFLTTSSEDLTQWSFPGVQIPAGSYLVVFASGKNLSGSSAPLHTGFRLSSDGEFLALVEPDGVTVAHQYSPAFPKADFPKGDYSFGLAGTSLTAEWRFFAQPTPGAVNQEGVLGVVGEPVFSAKHGFYDAPFDLTLQSGTQGAVIYYTTDGSEPSAENGEAYQGAIRVSSTTPLRAVAVRNGYEPSKVVTRTYIFLDDVLSQTRPAGYPTTWANNLSADYDIDPDVVNDPRYRDTIKDDLRTIPSLSVVMHQDDLFERRRGIYANPEQKGVQWERPCSIELIHPDGSKEGFQENCGIRIQGGYSRVPDRRKHSFRTLFKREYGEPVLEYKLIEDSSVERFDGFVLRGSYNYSWHGGEGGFGSSIGRAEYMRDEFARRTQAAAGQPAAVGTYVHLYLNGMYWGLYDLCERPDDSFSSEHIGGEKEDWDVVTGGTRGINTTQVKAGNKQAWTQMMTLAERSDFSNQQEYDEIQDYVDVDNLIDYMLTIYYTGNRDAPTVIGGGGTPWNFYSSRHRLPGAGYKFYAWDSEWTLEEPDRNVVTFHNGNDNPARVFQRLRTNPEFLVRVADHVQKLFFNDGAFTPEKSIERYTKIAQMIDRAIVGESARWGDRPGGRARTRDDDWLPEVVRIRDNYLPLRTAAVVQQLREANLFPSIDSPAFNQHGGQVGSGFTLAMESQRTIVNYETVLRVTDPWQYNQDGVNLGTSWRSPEYDDSAWSGGRGLFYVENSELPAPKVTGLTLGRTAYYFRKEFTLDSDIDPNNAVFRFRTVLDDGAILYLNGVEFFRIGMPQGSVNYNTFADRSVGNAEFEGPFELPAELFRSGSNVIAVEVHQTNANSSDVVFGFELEAAVTDNSEETIPVYYTTNGSDPRLHGGAINPDAQRYTGPVPVEKAVTFRARAKSGDEWSALNEAVFTTSAAQSTNDLLRQYLRVTEVMYAPEGEGNLEYLELHNAHTSITLSLDDLEFNQGITYLVPFNVVIPPGGYVLVTNAESRNNFAAFRTHYGLANNVVILGPFAGRLANEGERVSLISSIDLSDIFSFEYSDGRGWAPAADGAGHSLVPLPAASARQQNGALDYGGNWRASFAIKGSPGKADPEPTPSLVISEFKAVTDAENANNPDVTSNDWIEIHNPTTNSFSLSGWYLSDNEGDLKRWAMPAIDVAPGAYISFDEVANFNNPPGSGFGLNKDGEQIFLSYLPGVSGTDRVVNAVRFKGQEEAFSLSRIPDGSPDFLRTQPSRNQASNLPVSDLIVDEFMYNPVDDQMLEFIEILNPTSQDVNIEGWRLDGGVTITFTNVTVSANGRVLVVPFAPTNTALRTLFIERYGLGSANVTPVFVGPYEGNLANGGERFALEKPQSLDELGVASSWVIVDEVIFFDQEPWDPGADGSGKSLQRQAANRSGNAPSNWENDDPTPGLNSDGGTSVGNWSIY